MLADKIPDEIMEEALRLTESAWQLKHPELAMKVARALMARDKRSAEIALAVGDETEPSVGYVISQAILTYGGRDERR